MTEGVAVPDLLGLADSARLAIKEQATGVVATDLQLGYDQLSADDIMHVSLW